MNLKITYIQSPQALTDALGALVQAAPAYVAIDTEFTRRTTYWPQLELIQLSSGTDEVLVIDCKAVLDLNPLVPLLMDDRVIKVFHSARQDLEGLWKILGIVPAPIFDLQVAAAFLGFGMSIGLNDLVQQFLDTEMDKGEQHSTWHQRPLRPAQIQYAALDVAYVARLYPLVMAHLKALGRHDWPLEFCQDLSRPSRLVADPSQAWVRLKNHVASEKSLFMLYHLASLREQVAQELDVNRTRLLPDKDLIDACRILSATYDVPAEDEAQEGEEKTHAWLQALPSDVRPDVREAFLLLQQKTYGAMPRARDLAKFKKSLKPGLQPGFSQNQHQQFLDIKRIVNEEANRLVIPASYLAPTSLIESYVAEPTLTHPLISGWRQPLLRHLIVPHEDEGGQVDVPERDERI